MFSKGVITQLDSLSGIFGNLRIDSEIKKLNLSIARLLAVVGAFIGILQMQL